MGRWRLHCVFNSYGFLFGGSNGVLEAVAFLVVSTPNVPQSFSQSTYYCSHDNSMAMALVWLWYMSFCCCWWRIEWIFATSLDSTLFGMYILQCFIVAALSVVFQALLALKITRPKCAVHNMPQNLHRPFGVHIYISFNMIWIHCDSKLFDSCSFPWCFMEFRFGLER